MGTLIRMGLPGLSSLADRTGAICQDIQAPELDIRLRKKTKTEKIWEIRKQTSKKEGNGENGWAKFKTYVIPFHVRARW